MIVLCFTMLVVSGCSNKESAKDEAFTKMPLEEMVEKLYAGKENDLPNLVNTPLTQENLTFALGVDTLDFEEGIVSEPMISSIAHSVVLVRMKEGADIEKAKKDIKEKVDPRKWICVEVNEKDIIVDSRSNVIALIMVNDFAKDINDNFKAL